LRPLAAIRIAGNSYPRRRITGAPSKLVRYRFRRRSIFCSVLLAERHKQRGQGNEPNQNTEDDKKTDRVNGKLSLENRVSFITKVRSHGNRRFLWEDLRNAGAYGTLDPALLVGDVERTSLKRRRDE